MGIYTNIPSSKNTHPEPRNVITITVMPNTLAKNVLAEYLAMREPGYALLINAPWGAGKTEFIKKQTQYENNQNNQHFLYLSLFGIASEEAFSEALLGAIMRNPGNGFEKKARRFGETLKNIASNIQAVGFSVNMSSFSFMEGLRKYLPDTLIFDDLERIAMPQANMSGLLNRFIEHEKRRVILIANTDKIKEDEKYAFDTTREKAIGRIIHISPDIDAALVNYWAGIPAGHGTEYLKKNQLLIKDVFNQGGHCNLRLLHYAIKSTANLFNKIDEELYLFEQPIERLARTFLALHMAYGAGRIGQAELAKRNVGNAFGTDISGNKKPDQQLQKLVDLEKAHPDCDIRIPYTVSPLTYDLAILLLAKGFADKDTINNQLRQTHLFSPPGERPERPDWIKLWHWDELSPSDLKDVLNRLATQLSENKITNPGEFIQIYGAMHWIARFGGLEQTQEELSKAFLGHIQSLSEAGEIKPRRPSGGDRERYIFEHNNGRVSYGGYAFDADDVSEKVVRSLKDKMEGRYNDDLANVASHLLEKFEGDTEDFLAQFIYDHKTPNYASAPILHLINNSRFSDRLFYLIENDREVAKRVANLIKSRHQKSYGDLSEEDDWVDDLKNQVQAKATAASRLFGAQVKLFILREF